MTTLAMEFVGHNDCGEYLTGWGVLAFVVGTPILGLPIPLFLCWLDGRR